MEGMDEACEPCEPCSGGQAMLSQTKTVSLTEKLMARQEDIERHLADVKRARELLTKNPELEELLTLLDRTGRKLY